MKNKFDTIIPRKNTSSVKWDMLENYYGSEDLIPLWVADMDFQSPKRVISDLIKKAEFGIYGYTSLMPSYYDSIINWFKKRHGFVIEKEWIVHCPGVVPAINMLIQSLTNENEKIIIQPPVYYPFMNSVVNNSRKLLQNSLIFNNGKYQIDFEDLENKAKDLQTRMLILCSPHNPVGRVWSREELLKIGNICNDNNVIIISDEIHCDIILGKNKHIPLGTVSEDILLNTITCTSPSKTFNLAGLNTSNIIIADPILKKKFTHKLKQNGLGSPNLFGAAALESAYKNGEEWLDNLLQYIEENLSYLKNFITTNIPQIKIIEPESTYLVWLDFRELGLSTLELKNLLLKKAGLALSDGYIFGENEGKGFERINIACPLEQLRQAMTKLQKAIDEHLNN